MSPLRPHIPGRSWAATSSAECAPIPRPLLCAPLTQPRKQGDLSIFPRMCEEHSPWLISLNGHICTKRCSPRCTRLLSCRKTSQGAWGHPPGVKGRDFQILNFPVGPTCACPPAIISQPHSDSSPEKGERFTLVPPSLGAWPPSVRTRRA